MYLSLSHTHTHTHTVHTHELWMAIIILNCDTLVLCISVDHCSRVLLLASGLAREQSHYSRVSNCRDTTQLGHGHIPTDNGHVHPSTRPDSILQMGSG